MGNACVHLLPVVWYEVDMNIKTKTAILFSALMTLFAGILLFGVPVAAQTDTRGISDRCPDGLIYDLTSKKCERITESRDPDRSGGRVTCPTGYTTYFDKCVKTVETSVEPCPADEIGRGSSDPGCWKKSNAQGCTYQSTYNTPSNTSAGKDDQCWTAGRPTNSTPATTTAAKDEYVKACVASGKTEQECRTSANAIENNCAEEDAEEKALASCIAKAAASEYGKCDDGSKPNSSTGKCADGSDPKVAGQGTNNNNSGGQVKADGGDCGGAKTAILDCGGKSGEEAIAEILRQFIFILSVGVGIVAVGGIVFGAVLYASARDNASQTQKAVEIIRNTVIGIILYVFMVSLVNWLVPGGVIG